MEFNDNKTYDDKISPPSSPSSSASKNSTYSPIIPFPLLSPNKKKINKTIYGDRYIPNRNGVDLSAAFSISNADSAAAGQKKDPESDLNYKREQEANLTFTSVLKAELFGDYVPGTTPPSHISNLSRQITSSSTVSASMISNEQTPLRSSYPNNANSSNNITNNNNNNNNNNSHHNNNHNNNRNTNSNTANNSPITSPIANSTHDLTHTINTFPRTRTSSIIRDSPEKIVIRSPKSSSNLLSYKSPRKAKSTSTMNVDVNNEIYSLSPVRSDSQRLLLSPQKKPRRISKVPYRVLDAPDLADDFYLNLVDWGSQNILAVGLGSCVYLWDAVTCSVERLCDLGDNNKVTGLSWIGAGTHLAIGTNLGLVEIWDVSVFKCTRTMTGHISRVGSLAWNEHILTSGSRDRSILNRDVRVPEHYIHKLDNFHKQEVCGLKWNVEENKLASGGNDNNVMVWDGYNTSKPLHKFTEHTAAIKAIAWCPHKRGVLASGGGTADRRIKIWNTLTGTKLNDIDTGSQVCNLLWSKNSNELVSTHGYSKNQIVIWKYNHHSTSSTSPMMPTATSSSLSASSSLRGMETVTNYPYQLQQVASLTGHTYRVLYLAMSPDGETIVTGAGDETLRFWKTFEKNKSNNHNSILLDAFMQLR